MGYAIDLDAGGGAENANCGDNAAFDIAAGTDLLLLCAIKKTTTDTGAFIVGKSGHYWIETDGSGQLRGKLYHSVDGYLSLPSTTVPTLNAYEWLILSYNYSAGEAALFYARSRIHHLTGISVSGGISDNESTGFGIGDPGGIASFRGLIDEVYVSTDITGFEPSNTTISDPSAEFSSDANTVCLYHCNEGTLNLVANAEGTAALDLTFASAPRTPNWSSSNDEPWSSTAPIMPQLPIAIKEHALGQQIATGGFMDGDSDADGDALSYEITQRPSHGVLTELIGGAFNYLPNAGYVGPDEFRYRPWAGGESGSEYTVTITVTGAFTGILPTAQIKLKVAPLVGDFPVAFNGVLPTLKLPIKGDKVIGAEAPVNAVLPTDKLFIKLSRLSAVIEPGVLVDYETVTYNISPDLSVRNIPLTQYANTDNASVLVIVANDNVINLGVLTRAVMILKTENSTVTVDSDVVVDAFDWTPGDGKLVVRLGGIAAVTPGRWSAQLVLYDALHDDGIAWGENFLVVVK